jgi:hypothetical protein
MSPCRSLPNCFSARGAGIDVINLSFFCSPSDNGHERRPLQLWVVVVKLRCRMETLPRVREHTKSRSNAELPFVTESRVRLCLWESSSHHHQLGPGCAKQATAQYLDGPCDIMCPLFQSVLRANDDSKGGP